MGQERATQRGRKMKTLTRNMNNLSYWFEKMGGLPMELAVAVCHLLVAFAYSQEGFALWFR